MLNTKLNGNGSLGILNLEIFQDFRDGFGNSQLIRAQFDFRFGWRLVGSGDAGEFLDLVGARFGVKAFGIALFADFQRRIDEDFNELSWLASFCAPGRDPPGRAK